MCVIELFAGNTFLNDIQVTCAKFYVLDDLIACANSYTVPIKYIRVVLNSFSQLNENLLRNKYG